MARSRQDVPVARVQISKRSDMAVSIHGFTAAEMGVPLVEMQGALEYLEHLTIEQAEKLAEGLLLAARVARGEALPTALDAFMAKRGA